MISEQNKTVIRITVVPLVALCALALVGSDGLAGITHYILSAAAVALTAGVVIAVLSSMLAARPERRPNKTEAVVSLVSLLAIGISAAAIHLDWARQSGDDKKELASAPSQSMPPIFPPGFPPGISQRPSNAVANAHPSQSEQAHSPQPRAMKSASPDLHEQHPPAENLKVGKEIDSLLARADEEKKKNQFAEAEALYSKALSLIDSTFPDALGKRGPVVGALAHTLFSSNKVQNAIDVIDDHVKKLGMKTPQDLNIAAQFFDLAGTFLGNSNRFDESIKRFERSLALKSKAESEPIDVASTHAKIAISYASMGNKEEARDALIEAKSLLEANVAPDDESLKRIESIAEKYDMSL
ncbi:MAG: hypothetical protein GY847_35810 [Proteobacteria bacterium]|nr:hypothetical protein [Pseudomonadota bacterium]